MILVSHGAFDFKKDRNNGIAMLVERLRELNVSANVVEINADQWYDPGNNELVLEQNIYIGYSNGGHQVRRIYNSILERESDPELTSVQGHFIFLDFVYKGLRQIFDRAPLWFPTSVISAWGFFRTLENLLPPFHSMLGREDGKNWRNIPVESDHGHLPSTPFVQDSVCQRVEEIMKGTL